MRVIDTRENLLDHVTRAAKLAGNDTLNDVEAHQVKRTGRLARGTDLQVTTGASTGIRMRIFNTVVYADAVERGAWTREKASVRRGTKRSKSKKFGVMQGPLLNRASSLGPHMVGNHVVRDTGPRFLQHMTTRLRQS